MKSPKQLQIEKQLLKRLSGVSEQAAKLLFADEELQYFQEYANIVSIKRLGFNDHGPVHMRMAALNSLIMFDLLHDAGVPFNLEQEGCGTVEDSRLAVFMAALLHDLGMSVGRERHELHSVSLAQPIIERILKQLYDRLEKQVILRALITEGIAGHMATQKIHSLEAGLVLLGDGCDMEQGRARIPALLSTEPKVGDIHRYSASAIQKVIIQKGQEKPIQITIEMKQSVGLFQVEEVLFPKIKASPVQPYIELWAGVPGRELLRYL